MFKYAEIRTGNRTLLGSSFEAARSCGYNPCLRFHNKFTVNVRRSILQKSVILQNSVVFHLASENHFEKPCCQWSQDLISASLQEMNHTWLLCNVNVRFYWKLPEFIIECWQEAAISEMLMPFSVSFQTLFTPLSTMQGPWHLWPWPATNATKDELPQAINDVNVKVGRFWKHD